MSVESQQCDHQRIARFLAGELSVNEVADLQQHLDDCLSCQSHLEDSTATAMMWKSTAESLRDEPDDMESLSELLTRSDAEEITRQVTDDGVRRVVDLLMPTDDPSMLGRIGTYEVAGVIGSGGNGIVLKAHDPALNRFVAIKVLAPHLASSGAARQRFAREAQAAAAVVHENVIAIHGVAESKGLPYLVMPYERGESLQRRIDEHGPLGVSEILRIGLQTASGLAAAHAQGLVHRDIKPANILLADGVERVTITDFGLARATDDASMTRSGIIAGTPQYMSPEQARGDAVDHRSDLFSFGSVLYAMCAGHPPFRAESSYGTLQRICQTQPRPLRQINTSVPGWLCALIDRLLAKEPEQRYSSAGEVAALLEQCLAHMQQPDSQPLPSELVLIPATRSTKHRRKLVAGIGSLLVLSVVAAVAIFPPNARRAETLPSGTNDNSTSALQQFPIESHSPSAVWDDQIAESISEVEGDLDRLERESDSLFGEPN